MLPRLPIILVLISILGVLLAYLPWQLLRCDSWVRQGLAILTPFGAVLLFVTGVTLAFSGAYYLIRRGDSNPLTFTPPQRLVVAGPYTHIQHPMLLGMLLTLFGEALWLRSPSIGLYGGLLTLLLQWYILRIEEPRLEERFGVDYRAYRSAVPRWLPWCGLRHGSR